MDDEKDSSTLAGSTDSPLEEYKKQAKQIMRQMSISSPPRCTISSGNYNFQ